MAWKTADAELLKARLSRAEFNTLVTSQTDHDSCDLLQMISQPIVAIIRGYVAGNERNTLGPAGTIPEEAIDPYVTMMRHRLIARMADFNDEPDSRRVAEYDEAKETLLMIQDGRIPIEQPEEPSDQVMSSSVGSWGSQEHIDFNAL